MSKIVDPYKKFTSLYCPKIHLEKVTYITKEMQQSNPMWASIKAGYDFYEKNLYNFQAKYVGMYYSLLNAAYTSKRLVFIVTRRGLRKILSQDNNMAKSKIKFSNGSRNSDHNSDQRTDHRTNHTYPGFLSFLQKNNLVKILNINRKSNREPMIFQIVDKDFVDFFDRNFLEQQITECELFVGKKTNSDHKTDHNSDQRTDLDSKYIASSSSSEEEGSRRAAEEAAEKNKKKINDFKFEIKNESIKTLIKEKIETFTKDIKFGPKNSGGKKIEQKVEEFLDFMPRLGPVIPEEYIYTLLEAEFKNKKHPVFSNIFETYKKYVKFVYKKNVKQFEERCKKYDFNN